MMRRRLKRAFALLLAALMLFGALSVTAAAESGGTAKDTEAGQTQEQPGDGAEGSPDEEDALSPSSLHTHTARRLKS